MHEHHHCHEHGGQYHRGPESRGAAIFYGYCHDTGRMRMMDYPDYVSNLQTGYQNMYQNVAGAMQSYLQSMQPMQQGAYGRQQRHGECPCCGGSHHHHHGDECRCGESHHEKHHHDCHCSCCIKCADAVEYARCGEVRHIPITLENDTRRERDVTLQLGGFATAGGKELGWQAALSETSFKLGPCAEKTVVLRVPVDCSKFDGSTTPGTTPAGTGLPAENANRAVIDRGGSVSECKVAYATLRAEGCTIRPIVIAVAVLPDDCGAHRAGCGCGCCC